MALSDYDTLAINHTGAATNGSFISPLGVSVDLYKNWIYVRDPDAWQPGAYVRPTIMEIQDGFIRYRDVTIVAMRRIKPTRSIFALAYSGYNYDSSYSGMVGVAGIGWRRDEFTGITNEHLAILRDWLGSIRDRHQMTDAMVRVGFEPVARFNQGDAYIAKHLGFDAPMSDPGNADVPLLIQAIHSNGDGN